MTWIYQGKEVTGTINEDYVGFVYRITCLTSGKIYVGKKLLNKVRTKKIKGKKRRTKVRSESDWKSYFGSNKLLLEDVKLLGADNFKREILHLCTSKGSTNYMELKEQILQSCLEREDSYNQWIMCRVHRSHLKGS